MYLHAVPIVSLAPRVHVGTQQGTVANEPSSFVSAIVPLELWFEPSVHVCVRKSLVSKVDGMGTTKLAIVTQFR